MKKKPAFEKISEASFEKLSHEEANDHRGGCHTYRCYPVLTDTGGGGGGIVSDPGTAPTLEGGETISGQTDYVCGYEYDCQYV
ncbi:hypothetical protein AB9P05_04655 [Roseivirga sp. BDSF3-8]|uniref:hypothetical protein n=1 Tax=Roseivirga sp. BDSF3-8 TaxID=3241598 RepID=UPI003531BA5E